MRIRDQFALALAILALTGIGIGVSQELVPIPPAQDNKPDLFFFQLTQKAVAIDRLSTAWNAKCASLPRTDQGCLDVKKLLNERMTVFIVAAAQYHKTGGGCQAEMRYRVVQRVVALYRWNLKCAGNAAEHQCVEDSARLNKESDELRAQVDECLGLEQRL